MTKLEELENSAYTEQISIIDAKVTGNTKAMSFNFETAKIIAMDKSNIFNSIEEKELLAEEVGHFVTNAFYCIAKNFNHPLSRLNARKAEAEAENYKIDFLVSVEDIQGALDKGCREDWEIAEYCDCSVELLRKAILRYERKGITFKARDADW